MCTHDSLHVCYMRVFVCAAVHSCVCACACACSSVFLCACVCTGLYTCLCTRGHCVHLWVLQEHPCSRPMSTSSKQMHVRLPGQVSAAFDGLEVARRWPAACHPSKLGAPRNACPAFVSSAAHCVNHVHTCMCARRLRRPGRCAVAVAAAGGPPAHG